MNKFKHITIFNTGRGYTDKGQIIGAALTADNSIIFHDISRMVCGIIGLPSKKADEVKLQSYVMQQYDANKYAQTTLRDVEELTEIIMRETKKPGFKSRIEIKPEPERTITVQGTFKEKQVTSEKFCQAWIEHVKEFRRLALNIEWQGKVDHIEKLVVAEAKLEFERMYDQQEKLTHKKQREQRRFARS